MASPAAKASKNRIIDDLAHAMTEVTSEAGCCTEADLVSRGFRAATIAAYGDQAKARASELMGAV